MLYLLTSDAFLVLTASNTHCNNTNLPLSECSMEMARLAYGSISPTVAAPAEVKGPLPSISI